jgi:hypothetical protein
MLNCSLGRARDDGCHSGNDRGIIAIKHIQPNFARQEAAHNSGMMPPSFRDDLAHHSEMMSPTIPG